MKKVLARRRCILDDQPNYGDRFCCLLKLYVDYVDSNQTVFLLNLLLSWLRLDDGVKLLKLFCSSFSDLFLLFSVHFITFLSMTRASCF